MLKYQNSWTLEQAAHFQHAQVSQQGTWKENITQNMRFLRNSDSFLIQICSNYVMMHNIILGAPIKMPRIQIYISAYQGTGVKKPTWTNLGWHWHHILCLKGVRHGFWGNIQLFSALNFQVNLLFPILTRPHLEARLDSAQRKLETEKTNSETRQTYQMGSIS